MVNLGDSRLSDVTVSCGTRSVNHGYLVPGAHAGYSGSLRLTKGNTVTIGWTGQDSRHHEVPAVLRQFPGSRQVDFRLRNDRVEVMYGDWQGRP